MLNAGFSCAEVPVPVIECQRPRDFLRKVQVLNTDVTVR